MRSNRKKRGNKCDKCYTHMYDDAKIKKELLESLHKMSSITTACKKAGIERMTFYRWKKEDEQFAAEVEQIMNEEQVDFAEDCLKERMQDGDTKAIIYFLNNRGKGRGWGEKQELAVDVTSGGQPIRYANIMPKKKPDGTDEQTA